MEAAEVVTTEVNCVTLLETMLRQKHINDLEMRNNQSSKQRNTQIISMEIFFSLLNLNQQNEAKLYKL